MDLSYHAITWRLRPDEFRGLVGHSLAALGIPDEASYLRRSCERIGRPMIEASEWTFYAAFNPFRLAAILQGIRKRALDGTAADAKALENGPQGADHCRCGMAPGQREPALRRSRVPAFSRYTQARAPHRFYDSSADPFA